MSEYEDSRGRVRDVYESDEDLTQPARTKECCLDQWSLVSCTTRTQDHPKIDCNLRNSTRVA